MSAAVNRVRGVAGHAVGVDYVDTASKGRMVHGGQTIDHAHQGIPEGTGRCTRLSGGHAFTLERRDRLTPWADEHDLRCRGRLPRG